MIYKSYIIEQNISSLLNNFVLIYGENLGLKDELKKKIKTHNKNSEIITFDQEEILKNIDSFFNEIYNVSLFGEKKIYIINHANDKILNIIQELQEKSKEHKFYFFSEVLDKKSKLRNFFEKSKNNGVVPCYNDNELSIKNIIQNRLKGFKGLSSENLNLIISNCGLDRIKLKNELFKISTFFKEKQINNKELELLLNEEENNDFNLLKDEALNGNKIKTNKLLSNTLFEPEKNIFYLNIINQRLSKLNQVFLNSVDTSIENAINMIKPPIFWKDKPTITIQAKKWNNQKIRKILEKTYKLEIEIKSNSFINKNILLKKLLIDICQLANS
tara:strand:+ start:952 stop:1941 length:990 start_codon:yes stop_codon:yes gene_type:complete